MNTIYIRGTYSLSLSLCTKRNQDYSRPIAPTRPDMKKFFYSYESPSFSSPFYILLFHHEYSLVYRFRRAIIITVKEIDPSRV